MFEYRFEVIDERGSSFGVFKGKALAQIFADAMAIKYGEHTYFVKEIV